MKIGILNLFPLRPHVEYMSYLSDRLGINHGIDVLSCYNDFETCHYKLVNGNNGLSSCIKCKLGSLPSYQSRNRITTIKSLPVASIHNATSPSKNEILNSLGSIFRIEESEILSQLVGTEDYVKLALAKAKMAKVTRSWVSSKNLDMVIVFNGRMDLMQSALAELTSMRIPVYTVESSNTDSGIRIQYGVSSVDHKSFEENLKYFMNFPLSRHQSLVAFSFLYNRLNGNNSYEWRLFKDNQSKQIVPEELRRYVLVLPSSMYEFHGLIDDACDWQTPLHGFDVLINHYRNMGYDIVFRFHPNWARKVGKYESNAQNIYRKYCIQNNIKFFDSDSDISTRQLIKKSSLVLVNGGSSAIEACLMLKQVINIYPAKYNKAGFVDLFTFAKDSILMVDNNVLQKRRHYCLRYLYFNMRIYPRLISYIKPITSLKYIYNYQNVLDLSDFDFKKEEAEKKYQKVSDEFEDEIFTLYDSGNFQELEAMYKRDKVLNDYSKFENYRHTNLFVGMATVLRRLLPKGDIR